jgi:hypothetical protein
MSRIRLTEKIAGLSNNRKFYISKNLQDYIRSHKMTEAEKNGKALIEAVENAITSESDSNKKNMLKSYVEILKKDKELADDIAWDLRTDAYENYGSEPRNKNYYLEKKQLKDLGDKGRRHPLAPKWSFLLDDIASDLEQSGELKLALEIDMISDRLEGRV